MKNKDSDFENAREVFWEFILNSEAAFFARVPSDNSLAENTVLQLLHHMDDVTRAVDALLDTGLTFPAIALCRSNLEASIRVAFLFYQEPDKLEPTAFEFQVTQSKINNLKLKNRSQKALKVAEFVDKPIATEFPKMTASNEVLPISDLDKKERNRINKKWSVSEMLRWLEGRLSELCIDNVLPLTNHYYGLTSHVFHADGIGLLLEEDDRGRDGKHAGIKQLSDSASCFISLTSDMLLALSALHFRGYIDVDEFGFLQEKAASVTELFDPYLDAFNFIQSEIIAEVWNGQC